jgi:hypothetical protein
MRIPGLVDEDLHARRVGALDEGRQVVVEAIVGTGGQHQELRIRVRIDRIEHALAGHRAVETVARVDARGQVHGIDAEQHGGVVHGLVAGLVDDHLAAVAEDVLHDHLVGGRGAIGHEEGAPRPEGNRRQVLRLLQDVYRVQERVQFLNGDGQVRVEDMLSHHAVEVRDPGAVAQAVSARVPRRVPCVARTLDVLAQRIGKRRAGAASDRPPQLAQENLHARVVAFEQLGTDVVELGAGGHGQEQVDLAAQRTQVRHRSPHVGQPRRVQDHRLQEPVTGGEFEERRLVRERMDIQAAGTWLVYMLPFRGLEACHPAVAPLCVATDQHRFRRRQARLRHGQPPAPRRHWDRGRASPPLSSPRVRP